MARTTGVREATVSAGVRELNAGAAPPGRARRPGGGRKRVVDADPARPQLILRLAPSHRGVLAAVLARLRALPVNRVTTGLPGPTRRPEPVDLRPPGAISGPLACRRRPGPPDHDQRSARTASEHLVAGSSPAGRATRL